MKQYRGGAVATTAKGDNLERGSAATGASLHNIYSARPVLRETAFKGYRQLVVKDNSNKFDDMEILRVTKFICSLLNFELTEHYQFENGKQGKRHVHAVVRAKKMYNLSDATEAFRSAGSITYDIPRWQYAPGDLIYSRPVLESHSIDLSSFTFEVLLFSSNEHIFYCVEDYFMKEQPVPCLGVLDTNFIDY